MAFQQGYLPVVVQFRGSSGVKLTSPMTYSSGQWSDVVESIDYIHNEYCREINRSIFAIGFSLGGNWLSLALGRSKHLSSILEAAACIQPPLNLNHSLENMKNCCWGMLNWNIGRKYKKLLNENLDYLYPVYKQKYKIDLKHFVKNLRGVNQFEEELNWKVHKHKDFKSY